MSGNVHVIPSDHGWDVRIEGGSPAAHFQTQDEAIRVGRTLARDNRSEHIVHGRDGRIRQRDSYGHNPFRP
jgi:Uncharacterized protein conserved in bacteria (DUF2188)